MVVEGQLFDVLLQPECAASVDDGVDDQANEDDVHHQLRDERNHDRIWEPLPCHLGEEKIVCQHHSDGKVKWNLLKLCEQTT